MSRRSKYSPCVTYHLPEDKMCSLLSGTLTQEEMCQFKVRSLRSVSLVELVETMSKYCRRYAYASWWGKNAEVFKLVNTLTGEIIKEIPYITTQLLEDYLGYDIQHSKIVLYVY